MEIYGCVQPSKKESQMTNLDFESSNVLGLVCVLYVAYKNLKTLGPCVT